MVVQLCSQGTVALKGRNLLKENISTVYLTTRDNLEEARHAIYEGCSLLKVSGTSIDWESEYPLVHQKYELSVRSDVLFVLGDRDNRKQKMNAYINIGMGIFILKHKHLDSIPLFYFNTKGLDGDLPGPVGIHVRRGDYCKSYRAVPITWYCDVVDALVDNLGDNVGFSIRGLGKDNPIVGDNAI